jgi:hypothetical protein
MVRLATLPTGTAMNGGGAPFEREPTGWDLSRRRFLGGAAAAGAVVAAGRVLWPSRAYGSALPAAGADDRLGRHPKPIPFGLTGDAFGDPSNHHLYHVLPPLPAGSDGNPGQYSECSTITDFDGLLGAANINGRGTGTPRKGNAAGRYDFNVDMRFMTGTYVGADGRSRNGTFGFI